MVKALIRFVLIWALSMLVTPYIDRWLSQLAHKAPKDSFLQDMLFELSGQYSTGLIHSLGESVGELFLGSKK
jgi:hypothetical protein